VEEEWHCNNNVVREKTANWPRSSIRREAKGTNCTVTDTAVINEESELQSNTLLFVNGRKKKKKKIG